jgi:hypothetical protein
MMLSSTLYATAFEIARAMWARFLVDRGQRWSEESNHAQLSLIGNADDFYKSLSRILSTLRPVGMQRRGKHNLITY